MKIGRILTFLTITFLVFSCAKNELNFSDLSTDVLVKRTLAMPLLKGEIVFEDVVGETFDSIFFNGEDTVKLYLITGYEQTDTLPLGDQLEGISFEYLNLHHTFTNMFPVGVDVQLYLHDSISKQNIDTILFASNSESLFLPPAPVDEYGLVKEEQVQTITDVVALDAETLDNLTERTTHMVFYVYVPPTDGFVKILDRYLLSFKMGIEAKGEYATDLDSSN